ncbi:MAG: hypothetical protein WBB28_20670 [Crinalium sp.]
MQKQDGKNEMTFNHNQQVADHYNPDEPDEDEPCPKCGGFNIVPDPENKTDFFMCVDCSTVIDEDNSIVHL